MSESPASTTSWAAAGRRRQPGLNATQVAARVAAGHVNRVDESPSRSLGEIVRANVLTRFNALITALGVVVLLVGEPRDALFAVVMILNATIGVAQELRSKATLDRLSVVAAPRLTVLRDGVEATVGRSEVVLDDTIVLVPGDQLVVDGLVIEADELRIDESLLTGEADPVAKQIGDAGLSGSFVVAGTGLLRATAVGEDAYAAKLTREARTFRRPRSELERAIDRILRWLTWLIVPAAIGLFTAQRYGAEEPLDRALIGTVAGLVALVPQGLVLLLSMAQAVAVIRLGRANVLVQQLQAVETLARVTLLATDKTGTLTTGAVTLRDATPLDGGQPVDAALAALAAADPHPDATMAAIAAGRPEVPAWRAGARVPFSSAHKYSAVDFGPHGVWYIGAPEVLLQDPDALAAAHAAAGQGLRVLALARSAHLLPVGAIPDDLRPAAIVTCVDEIRPDAASTIAYFDAEHVTTKLISGDNPRTAAAIAARCGVPSADRWTDARTLSDDPARLGAEMSEIVVFGRVTPDRKRSLVHAAQSQGEVVAMTGDGVNDTLALKDADLGIAMGSGTSAAKSVSELVLLDDRFARLPGVVAEGRRVIANIERVAHLFLTKTVWAVTFAVLIGLVAARYPLMPRQLTVVDAITIGIPGFVLSFAPSHEPARPGFLRRLVQFCVPVGMITGGVATAVFLVLGTVGADHNTAQSGTALTLIVLGLVTLHALIRPLDARGVTLLVALVALTSGAFTVAPVADYFSLVLPSTAESAVIAIGVLFGATAIIATTHGSSAFSRSLGLTGAPIRADESRAPARRGRRASIGRRGGRS